MWLKLENGHELDNPSARDIEQALSTLGENAERSHGVTALSETMSRVRRGV